MAGSGSDGDPLLASSLARFWPGDEAAAAEDEGARRAEEVELMAAGNGGVRRWPVAGEAGSGGGGESGARARGMVLFSGQVLKWWKRSGAG